MCGRFTLRTNASVLSRLFQVVIQRFTPRFNLAPSQQVKAIVSDKCGIFKETELRWGLIPDWSRNERSKPPLLINARSESVSEKPSFRDALRHRPCLVLADGFYEWQKRDLKDSKLPHFIHLADHRPFAFAGLWEPVRFQDGIFDACTILTTEANADMRPIHDRMPVILPECYQQPWLDGNRDDPEFLKEIFQSCHDLKFQSYPVGGLVNNPQNDRAECLDPASDTDLTPGTSVQKVLFE